VRLEFTKDLSKEDVALLERQWKETEHLRQLLIKIIENKLEQTISAEDSLQIYETHNFALKVADSRGFRRGLKYVAELLRQRNSAE